MLYIEPILCLMCVCVCAYLCMRVCDMVCIRKLNPNFLEVSSPYLQRQNLLLLLLGIGY